MSYGIFHSKDKACIRVSDSMTNNFLYITLSSPIFVLHYYTLIYMYLNCFPRYLSSLAISPSCSLPEFTTARFAKWQFPRGNLSLNVFLGRRLFEPFHFVLHEVDLAMAMISLANCCEPITLFEKWVSRGFYTVHKSDLFNTKYMLITINLPHLMFSIMYEIQRVANNLQAKNLGVRSSHEPHV